MAAYEGHGAEDPSGWYYKFDDDVFTHWISAGAVPVRFQPLEKAMKITMHDVLLKINEVRQLTCPPTGQEIKTIGIDQVVQADQLLLDLQERILDDHGDMPQYEINIDIPAERIADLMIAAIDSGDPVTTAAKGGWCNGINLISSFTSEAHDSWYEDPKLYAGNYEIEIIELDDETTGHETRHKVGPADMVRGLGIMAVKYPFLFKEVLDENIDAPCADIFLQCMLFGEEKYA